MVAPIRFLSGRQQQQKIGVIGSTEDTKVLEVIGRVGIGSINPTANLDVVGLTELDNLNVSGIATVGTFGVSGLTTTTNLDVVGLSTFASLVDINASVDISDNLTVDGLSDLDELNVAGIATFNTDVEFVGPTAGVTSAYWDSSENLLNFKDNVKATFGDSGDELQIYHTGSLSYISDQGPGSLRIIGNQIRIRNAADSEELATFTQNGSVELMYDGSRKFETTGIGVSIINGTSDTATIAGPENLIIDPAAVGDNTGLVRIKGDLYVDGTTTQINSTTIELADFIVGIATTATSDLLADGAGIQIGPDNTFLYEYNSGTNPSLKSSENLNVASGKVYQINQTERLSADTLSLGTGTTIHSPGSNRLTFGTNGQERVRIDSSGNFGIGTNIPQTLLHVEKTTEGEIARFRASSDTRYLKISSFDSGFNGSGFDFDATSSAGEISFSTSSNEKVRIDNAGNLGIGTNAPTAKLDVRGTVNVTGVSTFQSNVYLGDNDKLHFGDNNDLVIYSNGTSGIISHRSGGTTYILGDNIQIADPSATNTYAIFNGSVKINYNNNTKFETTGYGATIIGGLSVSGVSTFASNVDINAGLDVDGHTELDTLNVSVATTTASLTLANAGVAVTAILDEDLFTSDRADALATQQSIKAYVDAQVTAQDLDIQGDTGGALSIDLDSEVLTIAGTSNEIETSGSGNTITVGLPNDVTISNDLVVSNDLDVTGIATITTIDATSATIDNLTFTSGTAITSVDTDLTTVSGSDDTLASAKAIKTYVDSQVTAQDLDFAGDSGTGAVDLDSQSLTISGTASEIETSASGQTLTIGLPNQVAITTSLVVGSGVTITGSTVQVGGTITELYNGTFWNVVTQADVGYGASQVPLNQYLGQLAFLDDYHPNGLRRDGGGSDDVFVDSNGLVGINNTSPTSTLDVNGTLNVAGISTFASDVDINASIDVDGHTELDSTNISETLNVVGLTTLGSNVDINASVDISGNLDVHTDLDVDGYTELDSTNISETLNVVGLSTFGSNVDINADLDVDGFTELDATNISETLNVVGLSTFGSNVDINAGLDVDGLSDLDELNVAGLSTFASNVDINADLDVDGRTELDTTNISETLNVVGLSTFGSNVDINADLDVDGRTELDDLNVSGVSTFASNVDINAGLDVDGHTELDNLNVTGVATFTSNVNISTGELHGPAEFIIDPAAVGDNTGLVRIKGDLYVDGTTTQINSTTIEFADFNVGIATTVGTNLLLDGAGISIGSASVEKTFTYNNSANTLESSIGLGVTTGGDFKTGTDSVLNRTTLGPTVVNSSLTSVGTLTEVEVSGLSTFASDVDINASVDISTNLVVDGLSDLDELNVTGISTFQDNVNLGDNDRLIFGAGSDLQIFHNSSSNNSVIQETGTGSLILAGNEVHIRNAGANTDLAKFIPGGAVELYYDDSKKFETTGYGVTVSGGVHVSGISTFQNNIEVTGNIEFDNITTTGAATATLTTLTETPIHTGLSTSTYRSVEYTIQATEGTNFHSAKVLVVHDGTTAYHSEYGTIYNNTPVATFNADVSGGNLRLLAAGESSNSTVYKIHFIATKV
jgi:hypothetical protein